MPEQRYEYMTDSPEKGRIQYKDPAEKLNNHAKDGWEYYRTIELSDGPTWLVFRRELQL